LLRKPGMTDPEPAHPAFSAYLRDTAYDEMFDAAGSPRPPYRALHQRMLELPADELRYLQQSAELSFLNQGITFTVYGQEEGTERIFPYDLVPRILTAAEWRTIEQGLTQRITALNLFLKDIYHEGKVLADGVIPRELVYTCRHYRREMRGIRVPRDVYTTVVGTDLVRVGDGRFPAARDQHAHLPDVQVRPTEHQCRLDRRPCVEHASGGVPGLHAHHDRAGQAVADPLPVRQRLPLSSEQRPRSLGRGRDARLG
jgi:hypothetical protein